MNINKKIKIQHSVVTKTINMSLLVTSAYTIVNAYSPNINQIIIEII